MPLMNQVEYAAHIGVTKQAVGKMVAQSKIVLVVDPADGKKKIDALAADAALKRDGHPAYERRAEPEPEAPAATDRGEGYKAAKTKVTEFQAKVAELDWLKSVGAVVDRDSVESEIADMSRRIRDRILRIGMEIAGELAACRDEALCRSIVDKAHAAALHEIADVLEGRDSAVEMAAE